MIARRGLMVAALGLAGVGLAAAAPRDSQREGLVRRVRGAEVDWSEGTISAEAGAAADMRLPSPDVARPGAERRARAAAIALLREALRELPSSGKARLADDAVDAIVAKARTRSSDYQSNGGVFLTVEGRFADARPAAPRTSARAVLAVSAMPLEVSPVAVRGEREISLGDVVYQVGVPPRDADAIAVRRDRTGRLVLPASAEAQVDKLAGAPALIYVQKILR